jgi:hypothetical protein
MVDFSRRQFVAIVPGIGLAPALCGFGISPHKVTSETVWPEFPRQPPDLVREMVGVCHRDVNRARELLDQHPSLVNATWDWGFGDWETALGAAAHTGRRNIAELLLERGARLDIFAAAMLGQTETVKGMIAASPGIQRNPGPHGITLLAHARAGGDSAAQTLAYLESLGDADFKPPTQPLTDELKQSYVGRFESPALAEGDIEIRLNQNGDLVISVNGQSSNVLRHAGDHTFFPSGAPAVRITFAASGSGIQSFEIVDHVPVLNASRIS